MAQLPELPEHLNTLKSLLDDCSQNDLALINSYIVERVKQRQANSRAQHMARFQAGDRVSFTDKQGQRVEATVVRPNKKTVTLKGETGTKWSVSPELLHLEESLDSPTDKPTQLSLVHDDSAAQTPISSIGQKQEWVGGLLNAPAYITGEPGEPYRPQMYVWVNEIGQVVEMSLLDPNDSDYDVVMGLKTAIEQPLVGSASAPSHIRVNDARQAKELQLAFPSIKVSCAATPELIELQSTMHKELTPAKNTMTYSMTGASEKAIGDFFDAAAQLYRAKPWSKVPHDQSLISVSIDALGVSQAPLSVIGQMGEHFGIVLFDQLADHERYTMIGDAIDRGLEANFPPHSFLSFDPAKELEDILRKEISSHGWQVAGTKAYPLLMAPAEDRTMRPISPRDLTLFNAIAQALTSALSTTEFIDAHYGGPSTKFEQTVSTDSGAIKVVLESPYPYVTVMRENGATDSLFAELLNLERTQEDMDWDQHDRLSTQLQAAYKASPEAKAIKTGASISTLLFDFSFNYLNCTVATLGPAKLEEILYEIIPRKVMMPASEAPAMIEDAQAFFSFLKRCYQSGSADECLGVLSDDAASKMAEAMNNPHMFGMSKSALSEGTGFPFNSSGFPPELPGPSATKPKPKDKKSRKKQRGAARKARKKNR